MTLAVIFAGLYGAITWNLITWYFGLPTSSSHALFGGYAGAVVAKAGFQLIIPAGWTKTIVFIVGAPMIGLTVGLAPDHPVRRVHGSRHLRGGVALRVAVSLTPWRR